MTGPARLADLRDGAWLRDRLAAAGVSPDRAAAVATMLADAAAALAALGARDAGPAVAVTVPGRIEVLGKHTDYAGGRSLLVATERSVAAVAVPRADALVRVHDARLGETVEVRLDPELPHRAGWANYPATAARRLARDFPRARTGADVAFASDLPVAAGVSSSSALVVSVWRLLALVNDVERDAAYVENVDSAERLAGYLAAVENGLPFGTFGGHRGVGTMGGSEDHTAMLCARPGQLVRYSFAPVRFEDAIPLPAGHRFVVASSGVTAEKAEGERERYNRAAELTHEAARLWREAGHGTEATVGAILDRGDTALDRLRDAIAASADPRFPAAALLARVEQFAEESTAIVPAASVAVREGDLARFGALVDRSQALAERLLGNQVPETVHLARSARMLGAAAASAFGAGFGGSVWALVADDRAAEFARRWRGDYELRFPERAAGALFFQTRAGPPMARVA